MKSLEIKLFNYGIIVFMNSWNVNRWFESINVFMCECVCLCNLYTWIYCNWLNLNHE